MFKRKYPRIGWYVSLLGPETDDSYKIADHLHHNVITVDEEAYLVAQRLDGFTNPKDIENFSEATVEEAIDMFDNAGIIEHPHKILGRPCYFVSPQKSKQQKAIWITGKLLKNRLLRFEIAFLIAAIYTYFKHYTLPFLIAIALVLFSFVSVLIIEMESKYEEIAADYKATHKIDDFDF